VDDFSGLLALLDPDVVLRADSGPGVVRVTRGAERGAAQARRFGQDTELDQRRALVNGTLNGVTFRDGRPFSVLAFEIADDRIVAIDVLVDGASV